MYTLEKDIYFWLLAALPALVLIYVLWAAWRRRARKRFALAENFNRLSTDRSDSKPIFHLVLVLLALGALIVALVNPRVCSQLEEVKREGIDIVFALDVSKSMLVEDVSPDRLERARQFISRTIDQLAADRIGIVIYAGQAYPQLPITTDYAAARMFLRTVDTDIVPTQGTAIKEALELAASYFDMEAGTNKMIVVLSDGEDHGDGATDMAAELAAQGIVVHCLGFGNDKGGPIPVKQGSRTIDYKKDQNGEVVVSRLNEKQLLEIAQMGNGQYLHMNDTRQSVEWLVDNINDLGKTTFDTQVFSEYKDQFQWFIGLALFLLLWDSLLGYRKSSWLKKLGLYK